jgi:hypothetical protein
VALVRHRSRTGRKLLPNYDQALGPQKRGVEARRAPTPGEPSRL